MSEERQSDARRTLLLSIGITAIAIGLAVTHLIRPSLKIDQVTLILLAIAVLPWLSPLFRSIELPGGMKVEFQELKRELQEKSEKVDNLENRVERVEAFVLSGDVTPELKETLVESLQKFHDYLETLNLRLAIPNPDVHIDDSETADAYYDQSRGRLRISKAIAKDPQVVYHEYSHHVLNLLIDGSHKPRSRRVSDDIEAGLSDYYACSFTDNPILGQQVATLIPMYRSQGYVRNLLNNKRLTDVHDFDSHKHGEVWGGVFWDLRELLGKEADQILIRAWIASKDCSDDCDRHFVRNVLNLVRDTVGDQSASTAEELFERRGIAS